MEMLLLPPPQNIYCVYRITNLINGKVYIGQTSNPKFRWSRHKSNRKNRHMYGAFKKYGIDNFAFEILRSNLTKDSADRIEIRLIKRYKATNPDYGYNHANGGSHGTFSQASKMKLSNSLKNYYAHNPHPNTGKHMTKEQYEHHLTTRLRVEDSPWWCKGKSVIQIDKDTDNVIAIYPALSEASRKTGATTSNISKVCKGERSTAGGFKWKFAQ